jgi:hypothetical protein
LDDDLEQLRCKIKKALLLERIGAKKEAILLLESVISNTESRNSFRICRIEAMLALSDIYMKTDNTNGPCMAISLLFSVISLSDQYRLKLHRNLALVRFSSVLLHLNCSEQATTLLTESLPFILTNGDVASQGLAHFTMMKCLLSKPHSFERTDELIHTIEDAIKCIKLLIRL